MVIITRVGRPVDSLESIGRAPIDSLELIGSIHPSSDVEWWIVGVVNPAFFLYGFSLIFIDFYGFSLIFTNYYKWKPATVSTS